MNSVTELDLLVLVLGGRSLGIEARFVEEVLRAAAPSPLPGAPALVLGVLNVRGEPVPLLDVRRSLGVPPRPLRASDHLVVLRGLSRRLAIAVDQASEMRTLPRSALMPTAGFPASPAVVPGVVVLADGLMMMVDPARFLSDAEARALDELLS